MPAEDVTDRYALAKVLLNRLVNLGAQIKVKSDRNAMTICPQAFNKQQDMDTINRIDAIGEQLNRHCRAEALVVAYERAFMMDPGYFLDNQTGKPHALVDLLTENVNEGRWLKETTKDGNIFQLDARRQIQAATLVKVHKHNQGGGGCV